MKILYSKLNKHPRKLIREHLEAQEIEVKDHKLLISPFEVPYNKGSGIEGTMTDRELLLRLQKTMENGFAEVKKDIVDIKKDIKAMKNAPTMKKELKEI